MAYVTQHTLGTSWGSCKDGVACPRELGVVVVAPTLLVHPASWHAGRLWAALRLFQKRLLLFLENLAEGRILLLFILFNTSTVSVS